MPVPAFSVRLAEIVVAPVQVESQLPSASKSACSRTSELEARPEALAVWVSAYCVRPEIE
jgi:hypothetical protein